MKIYISFFFVLLTLAFAVEVQAQIINTPEGKVNCDDPNKSPWCGGRMSQGVISQTMEAMQKQCMKSLVKQEAISNNTLVIKQAHKQSVSLNLPSKKKTFTLRVIADSPLQVWLSNTPCPLPPVKQTNCLILADNIGKSIDFSTDNKVVKAKPVLNPRSICQLTEENEVFIHFQNNQNTSSKTKWMLTN